MDSSQVRSAIEGLLERELLGPGAPDEMLNARPSDIYLTGILWPRHSAIDADQDDSGSTEVASDDAEPVETAVPGYRAVRPCSIGITFECDVGANITVSLGATARYRPATASEDKRAEPTPDKHPGVDGIRSARESQWRRSTLGYRVIITPGESRSQWRTDEFIHSDGQLKQDPDLAVDIRRRHRGDRLVMTITLINTAAEAPLAVRDATLLFQTEIRIAVRSEDGRSAILPRETYPFADDEDHLTNLLLYRDEREFAAGHAIAAEWPAASQDVAAEVWTTWFPRARVASTSIDGHESLRPLRSQTPSPFAARTLSDANRRIGTCTELEELCKLYDQWIRGLSARRNTFTGLLATAADSNEKRCVTTVARMRKGVNTLRQNDSAWHAFALANSAMDRQACFPSKGSKAGPLIWRPFQLAFMLLVIPGLVDPDDSEACRDTMDLLWFPTGGGKTEAYLALTAFVIFHRRLTSEVRRNGGGTDVLMRYTLRLLTIQQFQRAAALIAACELLRWKNPGLGSEPISLGLYVGVDSTPNSLNDATTALQEEANGGRPPSTPRQLLECPACGAALPASSYRLDAGTRAMNVTCPADGCPTGNTPLPILTVDEAIYAHPPSLLIATADKFAQLPRNGSMQSLFGLPGSRLSLIIQDELHLISGPLGSMAGLYEATMDLLCTDGKIRPKVIGSTATIGQARRQVLALFDRDVLQFPPPGFEASDSFFAVRDQDGYDRVYRGVPSAGRSPKFALQAVLASLMQAVHRLRVQKLAPDTALNPYWTCVAYFNSLRELGGAHVLMLDDVRRQIAMLAARSGVPQRTLEEPPLELSSRKPSREIPEVLQSLNRSLGSADPYDPQPPDSVLASNMIAVGVDVPRLGAMVVAGQPKATAEYIQATSRVGRGLPGLVVTLYNFGRPRDLSHFEHFQGYHSALYRSVEASSVTPWAPRARDKALHAVFVAAVRHLVKGLVDDDAAMDFVAAEATVQKIVDYLIRRARNATEAAADADLRDEIEEIASEWERKASNARAAGTRFCYWEKRAPFGRAAPHLLCSAEEMKTPGSGAWPAPNSLREVEPSTVFILKKS